MKTRICPLITSSFVVVGVGVGAGDRKKLKTGCNVVAVYLIRLWVHWVFG